MLHYFILSLSEVIQFTRTWLCHIIRLFFVTLMCNSKNETVMLCFGVFCFVFLYVFFFALSVLLLAEAEAVAIVTSVSKTFW